MLYINKKKIKLTNGVAKILIYSMPMYIYLYFIQTKNIDEIWLPGSKIVIFSF